ncbi:hypothetical protein [Flammeovirga agarivorans]|nr:hypothetical protein [Flammeovirga agarivorans]
MLISSSLFSQTFEEHTIQFPMLHEYDGSYRLNEMGEQGLLVLRNRYGGEKKNIISDIEVTYVQTDFQKKWTKQIKLDHYGDVISDGYDDDYAYFLMKSSELNYQVLRIRLADGAQKVFYYKNVEKMKVDYFSVEDNIAFLGGSANNLPIITHWDLEVGTRRVLSSVHQIKGGIVCMEYDRDVDMLTVVIKAQMSSIHRGLYVIDYSIDGNIHKQYFEEIQREYNYQTFRPYHNSRGELVMIGTYGLGNESESTQGVYSMILSNRGYRLNPKFYDFSFFNNFYSHLDPKTKEKSQEKFQKRREKDKVVPLRLEVMPNRLQFMNGQVVFVINEVSFIYPFNETAKYAGDGFYSKAEVPTFSGFVQDYDNMIVRKGEYIPSMLVNEKMKENYPFPIECNFKRALACGFDFETGEMRWDNTYLTRNLKTELPVELVGAYADNRKVAFLHVSRDSYFYKVSERLEYKHDCQVISYKDYSPAYEIEKYTNGGLTHWYGNHFIHTGTKKIQNRLSKNESDQYFFLTCLSYSNRSLTD